jgi:phosphoglycolate phosphatase
MKLVLFDIDGTLTYHLKTHRYEDQYEYALKQVFGIDLPFDLAKFNGTLDIQNSWEMVRGFGITRAEFLQKFPAYVDTMHQLLVGRAEGKVLYKPIPTALSFVQKLTGVKGIYLGVISGNAKRIAEWKLAHTNLAHYFHFGLYGDEADSRAALAGTVFVKARRELGITIAPHDVVVIGDTVFDIRCGKAIGAVTIGVTTGLHGPRETLVQEHPTMVVDSLLDKRVLALFSLK